jgi:hypothetical protein
VNEVVEVLKRLFRVQKTLLRVNLEYIASASQDDNFRTEPPFKLQGSYRNMNKVTEKIVAAHTEDEVERVVEDHYAGESQTLTTGAEHNLLKLAELRGRLNDEQRARWAEIRKGFVRVKMMGGKDDDPTARVTGTLAGIGEQLSSIDKALSQLASGEASRAVATEIDQLGNALAALANREVMVQVEHDPTIAELLAKQLGTVESSLAPLVKAVADSLLIASHGAQSTAKDHAAALEAALGEAVQKVEQVTAAQRELASSSQAQAQAIATAREVVAAQQAQLVEASNVARQAAHAAQQAIGAAHQLGADAQNLIARETQLLAQETQLLALQQQQQQQQRAAAPAYAAPAYAMPAGAMAAGAMPTGSTLVQRPDASPEENEAIARAQLAAAAARSSNPGPGGVQPEVGAAVFRVEHRLGELTQLVRALQERLSQGVAQAASLQSEAMASAAEAQRAARGATTGNGGGGAVPRFDAAVDFESPSNFYRWKPKADVVNEGGVFISTRRKLPNLGQNVLVRLTLPGGVELEARAVVEWTRPVGHQGAPGFGARFVDLPTYGRQLVDHFVARREPILFEQA